MFFRKHVREPAGLVSRWLAAAALREPDSVREPMVDELDRTQWVGVESLLSEAFRLVIVEAYSPHNQVADTPDLVRGMRAYFETQGELNFSQEDGELLVRIARGEDLSISSVSRESAIGVCALFFIGVVRDLGLGREEINAVLVKAEALAEAGVCRPLISDLERNT